MKRMHNLVNSTQWDETSGRWLKVATTRSVQKSDLVGLLATTARNRMGNLLDVSTFMMCEIPAFLLDVRLSISSMVKLYMLHPTILVRNNWWRCSSLWANPRPFVYRPSAAPLSHFECCSAHRRLRRSHHFDAHIMQVEVMNTHAWVMCMCWSELWCGSHRSDDECFMSSKILPHNEFYAHLP